MRKCKWYNLIMILIGILSCGMSVRAATIYNSPYVSFSPDGQAWTTDAGNRNTEWYADDGSEDVITGVRGNLRQLQTGEHYYAVERRGSVPIAKWQVRLSRVNCCHNQYPPDNYYHGVYFAKETCFRPHFSGWRPICADCGQQIVYCNFYMSRKAAESIDYLELGDQIFYYYLCPFNNNLEQGENLTRHQCRAISPNRYRVVYDANAGADVYGGYMSPSFHMYDNATQYEGREVTPQTRLYPNTYTRIGWTFEGWNTKADGSGIYFADEAEILNLCTGDYQMDEVFGSVVLYALWRPAEGILEIDPGGGSFAGNPGITSVRGQYGEDYEIDLQMLDPPLGYQVAFDTMGGEPVNEIQGTQRFAAWNRISPFLGKLQGNCYYFCAPDGNTDRVLADYVPNPVTLPEPRRENFSFGGWYYDRQFTKLAGGAGSEILPTQNVTLYAQWVELILTATDNYEVNGGKGAVDLDWIQPDGQDKEYKLYQSTDGEQWEQIYAANDITSEGGFYKEYGPDSPENKLKIPYSGLYLIEAYGAQGSDFGLHKGGLGGVVAGKFWLRQGEWLSVGTGSQNGNNGGGTGTIYGSGGGYSGVESNLQGTLLIAGGGGGAGLFDDGGSGGLEEGLTSEGHEGDAGEAGGGGGYYGGLAGEAEAHYHTEGVCNHIHTGDASLGTGCYKLAVKCEETLKHVVAGTERWHWGGSDEDYCPNCGSNNCTGHERDYYDHICPVHGKQSRNYKANSPKTCSVTVQYIANCGRTEEYICGYKEDGAYVSSSPSYGGSNYLNTGAGTLAAYGIGEQAGDGVVRLQSLDIGYLEDHSLGGVQAQDRAAPDIVDVDGVKILPAGEETVLIQWQQPLDNGTVYYHQAESYLRESGIRLSTSNITGNTLVSGIKGYWYCVDVFGGTDVNDDNGIFTSREEILIKYENTDQYLHLMTEDLAGNRSDTVHIPISGKKRRQTVAWPIYTEQLSVQMGDSVYPAESDKTYYVRCDGKTPFVLEYGAYIQGKAQMEYQPNYAIIETDGKNESSMRKAIYVPSCEVRDQSWELPAAKLRFSSDGQGYLTTGGYVTATRSLQCKRLSVTQELLLDRDAHGQKLTLTPIAGADCDNGISYSDHQIDIQNGIWIIGDGEAPEILGLEILEELSVLDRRQGTVILRVTAEDVLSGVRELEMEIENLDNGCVMNLLPDEDGAIVLEITEDIPAFSGDFTVTVHAVDNVGNERTLFFGTTEFDLSAEITRVLEPHAPLFKRGESAFLQIASWGYSDRIEVEFPAEFMGQNGVENQVYVYEQSPMYKQEETYGFMIPLYVPENESYTVTVRAYKGDKMLERYPELTVFGVNGTVLDELRTRLR